MVHEDMVTCEGCGAEITHIVCGTAITEDEDYRTCDACRAERDADLDDFQDRLRDIHGDDFPARNNQVTHSTYVPLTRGLSNR